MQHCAALVLLSAACHGAGGCADSKPTSPGEVALNGEWRIYAGDRPGFAAPDYDDSSWNVISLPGSFHEYAINKTGRVGGILWIRKKIRIKKNALPGLYGLILGKIGNADMTWFNGVLVGSTGSFPPGEISQWNRTRFYCIPSNLVRPGEENVIALRISHFLYREVRGRLALTGIDEWNRLLSVAQLETLSHYMAIATLAAIGLVFFLIWVRRRSWKEYLYFVLQFIPGFFTLYEVCGHYWPVAGDVLTRIKVLGIAWTALVVFHLTFLHRLYKLERKKIEAALWLILAVNTMLIVYAHDPLHHRWIGLLVIISITPLALYNISIHVGQVLKGEIIGKILLLPGIILSLAAAHDGIAYARRFGAPGLDLLGYRFDELIFGYSSFMMFLGAAVILVYRFMNTMDRVEELNVNLEEKVKERTRELEESLGNLTTMINNIFMDGKLKRKGRKNEPLSPGTEKKIQKAVIYLNENYTSDISREGLAAWLDISPDHLGKAFKVYTGRRITDYINELRIKKASVILIESEDTILTIAYAVGFESLRTFNRVFTRIMKTTPSAFRSDSTAR